MAFSRNSDNVNINGQSVVKIGSNDVGFVANCIAKLEGIDEETNNGAINVGFNGHLEVEGKQTRDTDLAAWIDNLYPSAMSVVGNNDTFTLTLPTLSVSLEKNFSGKTGSKMIVKASQLGVNHGQAKAMLTRNS